MLVTRAKVRRERMGHISWKHQYHTSIARESLLVWDWLWTWVLVRLKKLFTSQPTSIIDPKETPWPISLDRTWIPWKIARVWTWFICHKWVQELSKTSCFVDLSWTQEEVKTATGQKRVKAVRRLDVLDAFYKSGNKPRNGWFLHLASIATDLRPMVSGWWTFAASGKRSLCRVISRNNRLARLLELNAQVINGATNVCCRKH